MTKNNNVIWHHATIKRADRENLNGHKSAALWFTGLSGSGKSTLAHAIEEKLYHICEQRDVKGLYAKARQGEIKEFTGISAPYEIPGNPELHLKTDTMSLKQCVDIVTNYLLEQKIIRVL